MIHLTKGFATFLLLSATLTTQVGAEVTTFSSGPNRVNTIELYTSEGCSSCPPADAWLSRLKSNPRLWKELIPMAFHVDYWDYIGWKDRFAQPEFSARQRSHQREGNIRTVYTPGFVVNGKEWRGWFRGRKMPIAGSEGRALTVNIDENRVSAEISHPDTEILELNLALLGFSLSNAVDSGENAGRELHHDFVVLATHKATTSDGTWSLDFPALGNRHAGEVALAAWVSRKGELKPIQATGGWLKN